MRVWLKLEAPELEYLILWRSNTYPREMRLCVGAKYQKAILTIERQNKRYEHEYNGGFYALVSTGRLRLSRENVSLEVDAIIPSVWNSGGAPRSIKIVSKPLTLEEIYEIDQALGPNDVQLYWSISAYGFLEEDEAKTYGIPPGTLVPIYIYASRNFIIARQHFVEKVLQPADMLKRRFIEVVLEPVDTHILDKIGDPEVREALRILLEKQKILQGAIEKLYRAGTSSEYKDVIREVRIAIEGLVPGKPIGDKIVNALRKAYKTMNIAREINAGALDELTEELLNVLKGFSSNVYGYASKLGSHGTTLKSKLSYDPRPYRHDAEFAVLQAMLLLNYMVKALIVQI